MASENEFEGKVAVVTGATSGMGRAAAIEFAAAGTNVVAAGRRVDRGLELEAEASSLETGGNHTIIEETVSALFSPRITPRETQVVAQVLEGHSSDSIAKTLGISVGTVRIHQRKVSSFKGKRVAMDGLFGPVVSGGFFWFLFTFNKSPSTGPLPNSILSRSFCCRGATNFG